MRSIPAFLFIFLLLFSIGLGEAGNQTAAISPNGGQDNQNSINQAIEQASQAGGGTVVLAAGTYEINGPVYIKSNVILTGDPNAIIRVSSSSSQWFVGQIGIISSGDDDLKNAEIYGFQIDGSCEHLPSGYANSGGERARDCERGILAGGSSGDYGQSVKIHDLSIIDCFSDGIYIRYTDTVLIYNNFISNCQHEGIYCSVVRNGLVEWNQIAAIGTDGIRLDNCQRCKVSNNSIVSYTGSNNGAVPLEEENGIQVGDAGSSKGYDARKNIPTQNIEITNNTLVNIKKGAFSPYSSYDGVYVHDNHVINGKDLQTAGIPVNITGNETTGIVYNVSTSNPPTKEMSEDLFASILNITFSDTGLVNNNNVQPEMNWQQKGHSKAWVDIVGWNNLTQRTGVFYIPAGEQPIVKYDAVATDLMGSTQTHLTTTQSNGNVTADLEVKTTYKVTKASSKSIMGISIPSYETHSETSHYFDTEKMPETYNPAINTTAYITILNNSFSKQTVVYVPENPDVMKVCFKYDGNEVWHYLQAGTVNSTSKGVKFVNISSLDYWDKQDNVSGNQLVIPGYISPKDVKSRVQIVQYDVYGNKIPITNFETKEEGPLSFWKLLPPKTVLFASIVGIFLYGTRRNLEAFR
jgi:Endopolygalacturonase